MRGPGRPRATHVVGPTCDQGEWRQIWAWLLVRRAAAGLLVLSISEGQEQSGTNRWLLLYLLEQSTASGAAFVQACCSEGLARLAGMHGYCTSAADIARWPVTPVSASVHALRQTLAMPSVGGGGGVPKTCL